MSDNNARPRNTVQRVPQVPFAQIANEALRDRRLSFKARGILAMVLSHSGEWTASAKWLESQSDHDGRAAIQTALNELTALGYRKVIKENCNGRIQTVAVWSHAAEMTISRPTENLTVRKSDRQETGGSLEHNKKEHNKKEHSKEIDHAATGCSSPDGFDDFWTTYPRKAAKGAARTAWARALRKAPAGQIIAAAARYRADPNREPAFTAHASTWLNQERWLDDRLPERTQTGGQKRINEYERIYNQINERREIKSG